MDLISSNLLSVEFDGLFGSVDDRIVLDADRPTVLTGANGTGKSTLLRLVSAASNGDLPTLASAPVGRFRMEFANMPDFELLRVSDSEPVQLRWGRFTGELQAGRIMLDLPPWAAQALEEHGYDVDLAREGLSEAAGVAGAPFAEFRAAREILTSDAARRTSLRAPDWLAEFAGLFPVLFVTDQRLVAESRPKSAPRGGMGPRKNRLAVESASLDIADQLSRADSDYARSSQQSDRNLPGQILDAMLEREVGVSERELADLVRMTGVRREALRAVGLLDESKYFEPDLAADGINDENVRRVMGVVLRSTLEKFQSLDVLERRLGTFKQFLDDRLAPKTLRMSRNEGMRFSLSSDSSIRPSQLSSGEQQITVLAYEILFKSQPGTLVIVDEPEISLHVMWQDTLIEDLHRMGKASGVQFLMATHSPIILAGHPDLERPLKSAVRR
ncbi:AAA family ATPase [Cellulomonas rhizosphaerae]|uniref:AAA family ATPase n=1 Tax=Cellulomonas rhizosphaerae TaxID=2293719 RepID=UPI0013142BFC|nr:AAA family ATPase [Cellulomonas rhizosphaerae]